MKASELIRKISMLPKPQRIGLYAILIFLACFLIVNGYNAAFSVKKTDSEPASSITLNEKLEQPLVVSKDDLPPSEDIESMLAKQEPNVNLNDFASLNPSLTPGQQGKAPYSIQTEGDLKSLPKGDELRALKNGTKEVKFEKEIKFFVEVYNDDILGMVVVQNSNNNKNLLLRLTNAKTGELSAQVHVPANDLARAMIPIGIYTAQVEQGFQWYGDRYGFAKKSTIDDLDVTVMVEATSKGNEAYLEFSSQASSSNAKAGNFFSDLATNR